MPNFSHLSHFRLLVIFTPVLSLLSGCSDPIFYKNTKASAISTSTYTTNYPIPDEYLNEKLQPNEKNWLKKSLPLLKNQYVKSMHLVKP